MNVNQEDVYLCSLDKYYLSAILLRELTIFYRPFNLTFYNNWIVQRFSVH